MIMELTTYHYTDFDKVALPCVDPHVYLLGDEDGPELRLYCDDIPTLKAVKS